MIGARSFADANRGVGIDPSRIGHAGRSTP